MTQRRTEKHDSFYNIDWRKTKHLCTQEQCTNIKEKWQCKDEKRNKSAHCLPTVNTAATQNFNNSHICCKKNAYNNENPTVKIWSETIKTHK